MVMVFYDVFHELENLNLKSNRFSVGLIEIVAAGAPAESDL